MSTTDKFINKEKREMKELKELHDSIEEGLPDVPQVLLNYAKAKANL